MCNWSSVTAQDDQEQKWVIFIRENMMEPSCILPDFDF
jgi:hypothetical protein